jgi:hypothetical protein
MDCKLRRGTLTPELMAVNLESYFRTKKVALVSYSQSVRHTHAQWASGEGTDSLELRATDRR